MLSPNKGDRPNAAYIYVIFDGQRLGESPLHHLGAVVVAVAQIREPHDVVLRFAILNAHNRRNDFDAEPLGEKGALLRVHFAELGLDMFLGQDRQVHVHDAAPLRRVAKEVADNVGRLLGLRIRNRENKPMTHRKKINWRILS